MAFEAQIDTAQRLIAANGATFTLKKVSTGSPPDADKPWRTGADSPTQHSVTAVVLPMPRGKSFENSLDEEDNLTQLSTRFLLVSAKDLETDILPSDTIDGIESKDGWEVVGSTLLAPNGEKIIWEVGVRR